tara:strand:- start:341 stop:547 length:207 start_codon:yes stop_codon:yes gene_type:complete
MLQKKTRTIKQEFTIAVCDICKEELGERKTVYGGRDGDKIVYIGKTEGDVIEFKQKHFHTACYSKLGD